MEKETIIKIIKESYSYSDCSRKIYNYNNGTTQRKVKKLIQLYDIDVSHFDRYHCRKQRAKYESVIKLCPVCDNEFETKKRKDGTKGKKERVTCSYSCSNTYFRSGINNGSYQNGQHSYKTKCFIYHKKECIICKEDKIVAVHHYDENHDNNEPKNLIPLCPTHHCYYHSKYRYLVQDAIDEYYNNFKHV